MGYGVSGRVESPSAYQCRTDLRCTLEIGVPVATRATPPPKLDEAAQAEFKAKSAALAPKYRSELLEHA